MSQEQKSSKPTYQNTFLLIHDDELIDINTEDFKAEAARRDFIEWNDSWKTKPNDVFKHQIRVESSNSNQQDDDF